MTLKYEPIEPSSETDCPSCGKTVKFYSFRGMGDMAPHFYCNKCSNVIFRESDRELLYTNEPNAQLLQTIVATLPTCKCGGKFEPNQNPKCPHCGSEMAHQSNAIARLTDPYAIIVEGAYLATEKGNNT